MPNHRSAILAISLFSATLLATPLMATPPARAASDMSGQYADFLNARFAAAQADSAAAAHWYLQALEQSPHDADLQRQAFMESALGGLPEATGLARLLPKDEFAQLWLAGQEAKAGNWSAVGARARALPKGPLADVVRPLLLAWSEQALGHTDAALAVLHPLEDDSGSHGIFALHEGMIADLAGCDQAAEAAMERAGADIGIPNLRFAQILASFDARHGRRGDGMSLLERAGAAVPELGLALPTLAADAERPTVSNASQGIAEAFLAASGSVSGDNDHETEAMLLLGIALDLRPHLTAARLMVSELDELHGQDAEARRELDTIPGGDPLAPIADLHRAGLMVRAGDTEGALAALSALARKFPQSALPLSTAAGLLRDKHRFGEAIADYDQAIEKSGATWTLYYARGVTRDEAHDPKGAEADMQRALRLAPNEPAVLNYIGYSWADRGQHLADARRMIETAVQDDSHNGAYIDSLGWVMLRQGDVADAISNLEHASELMPDDATVTGHLGDAYAAAGRRLEAGYEWQRALMLHPESAEAEQLKAKLGVSARQSASAELPR